MIDPAFMQAAAEKFAPALDGHKQNCLFEKVLQI